jgi:hypothetical protein
MKSRNRYFDILLLWFCICCFSLSVNAQTKPAVKSKPKGNAKTEEFIEGPDKKASFSGGDEAMEKYFRTNLKYPPELDQDTSIKSKSVFVKFMIDKSGKVLNAHVVKGIKGCKICTEEALRVVNAMPLWQPAVSENKKVDSWHSLPLVFMK